jgi:hypothetical protein
LQRIAHALGSHGDAVTDPDGIKAQAHQARGVNAFFDPGSQMIQVHVAGIALKPYAADPHLGLAHIVFG